MATDTNKRPCPAHTDSSWLDPVIDQEKAEKFVAHAHSELTTREELQEKWMGKRHINLETVIHFRVGFMEKGVIRILGTDGKPDWDWRVKNFWVLPITDTEGTLKGVKVHFEEKQGSFKGKSMWVQFGLEPKHDSANNILPKSAYYTLWPHIEHQQRMGSQVHEMSVERYLEKISDELRQRLDDNYSASILEVAHDKGVAEADLDPEIILKTRLDTFDRFRADIQREYLRAVAKENGQPEFIPCLQDYVVLCGGELEALAEISAGEIATSPTGGQVTLPEPRHFLCFRGTTVLYKCDDDPVNRVRECESGHPTGADRSRGERIHQLLLTSRARRIIHFTVRRR